MGAGEAHQCKAAHKRFTGQVRGFGCGVCAVVVTVGGSAVYEMLGQTVLRNREYHMMVPPDSQVYFGREFYNVRANGVLHFYRIY